MKCSIVFQPWGKRCRCEKGATVLEAARASDVGIASFCGGRRKCGKCKVRLVQTDIKGRVAENDVELSPVTEAEHALLTEAERADGFRLACCARVLGDAVLAVPPESQVKEAVILDRGAGKAMQFHPAVRCYTLTLEKPGLEDNRDDLTRILDGLAGQNPRLRDLAIDYSVIKKLPTVLRSARFTVTVLVLGDAEIIAVMPGKDCPVYGMAVDIGTTTVAAYLCDLKTGGFLEKASAVNPQISYGDDVLSRISYCMTRENGLETLQSQLMATLNALAGEMTARRGQKAGRIAETVLVFNTVMEHIALGITPDALGTSPFISGVRRGLNIKARELGLEIMDSGNVYCLPSEAGFVGSDNTAVLIAQEPYQQDKVQLIIDIGTNGELCLGNAEALWVTSCATGPAFEGAQIKWGMRASEGAVEHVSIDPCTLEPSLEIIREDIWSTGSPVGICGSGIIDAVAQMAEVAIIDSDGNFDKSLRHRRVRTGEDGKPEYVLAFREEGQDLVITQKDVRAVQLAKAALYAGAKILLEESPFEKIDEIVLAGAFGSYINVKNALSLGLFPDCPLKDIKVVGNAAGVGARMALLDTGKRQEAEEVSRRVHFVESAAAKSFYSAFGDAMGIPHKKDLFTANLPARFPCYGRDERQIPGEVREMKMEIHRSREKMLMAARLVKEAEKLPAVRLPLDLTTESRAFGGVAKWNGAQLVPGKYVCRSREDLEALCRRTLEEQAVREILECLPRLREDSVILDVQGPFSILASLMDTAVLFRQLKPEREIIGQILEKMVWFLVDYIMIAVERGVKVISLADPAGVMEMTGPAVYRAFSGKAVHRLFTELTPFLDKAVVHLCGKVAVSMKKAGYLRSHPRRLAQSDYLENLLALAGDPSVRFVGGGCINVRKRLPLINCYEIME